MAEQLLHSAQILTRFKKMRRERVAKQVRIDARGEPLSPCPIGDASLDRAMLEPRAVLRHEHGRLLDGRERRAFAVPESQSGERLAADWQDARLRALADHAHGAIGEIEVAQVEAHELIESQSR